MKNPLELFFETWHVIASVGQSDDSIKIVGPKVSLQTLEDRVLYDASPLAAFAAEVNDQINTESMEGADLELVENDDFEALEVPVATEFDENDLVLGAVEGDIKFQSARQLVVIDERVEGIEELINDVLDGQSGIDFEIIRLAEDADGIETITNLLDGSQKFDAIHIIGHGGEANVQLGATDLNGDNIDQYQQQLSSWTSGLALGADILLYGCDVAAGSEGESFVEKFQSIVGADVAASSDLTGNALLGGDWDFEFIVGEIETNIVFSMDVQQNWEGTLQAVTVTTLDDVVSADADLSSVAALNANAGSDGVISLREAVIASNANADADVIYLGAGVHTLSIAGSGTSGDLDINRDVHIIGLANGSSVVDGSGLTDPNTMIGDRIFDVSNQSATFQHLTITGGNSAISGGGIRIGNNAVEVIVDNVIVTGNHTQGSGGGIANSSILTVTNSTISSNTAGDDGGGIASNNGETELTNVTASGNEAVDLGGGVYLANDSHNLTNVTLSGNEANFGGGIGLFGGFTRVDLTNVTIADNTAGIDGGGIFNENGAVDANVEATIVSGNMACLLYTSPSPRD